MDTQKLVDDLRRTDSAYGDYEVVTELVTWDTEICYDSIHYRVSGIRWDHKQKLLILIGKHYDKRVE